jgi:predicted phosphoribosyltransferase
MQTRDSGAGKTKGGCVGGGYYKQVTPDGVNRRIPPSWLGLSDRLNRNLQRQSRLLFPSAQAKFHQMFVSREEAGHRLGNFLKDSGIQADLVVGLPRGGVVVASEVAHVLGLPLDVLVVRKIGHPLQREFAVGAMAEEGVVIIDERVVGRNPLIRFELDRVIAEEQDRMRGYQAAFHQNVAHPYADKSVLLVDDGLATGATTEAAVLAAKKKNARRVIVAAPVASTNAVERLSHVADDVRALFIDPDFDAVGRYYDIFSQTTDQEVMQLLRAA